MQTFLEGLARILGRASQLALWVAGISLVLMTTVVVTQVFFRYVLNNSIVWSEPMAVILMGWFIFFGAAVGIRDGYHLSFDILVAVVPRGVRNLFFSISDIVVGAFGGGMVWYGGQLAWSARDYKLPSLGVSGAVDFMPLVFGGVLIFIFSLERLARRAAGLPTTRFGDDHGAA